MTRTYQRSGWLVTLVVTAAVVLAACGGSANSPHVASLGKGRGGSTRDKTSTLAEGNPTQLLDEWAACVRKHGDPNQIDPTIDANKVIQVTLPAGFTKGLSGASGPSCASYLTAAQTALRGGQAPETPSPETALKFAECMRANGIPDYPDPTGDSESGNNQTIHVPPGSDLNPSDPTFQAASTLCANKTGFEKFSSGTLQPGDINLKLAGGLGGKPGGNGGAGANG